jgi:hypothetical protein
MSRRSENFFFSETIEIDIVFYETAAASNMTLFSCEI